VLLFEPKRMMAFKDLRTGTVHDMRTEALISGGFQRLAGPAWTVETASGWGVYRSSDTVVLRNADGEVAAKSSLTLDPAWISAAASQGWVLVLHGYPLGVSIPPGKTEHTYTVQDRAHEIAQARYNGLLAGALVKWAGALSDTLDWVLFPPGAFGLGVPLAYVPLWEFNRHGGPQEFGFTRLNRRVFLPFADGLAANITATDLDLVRPGTDEPTDRYVTGYRAGEESSDRQFFETWRQAVLASGGLAVMTGNREMPPVLGASNEQDQLAYQIMGDSWGAKVLLEDGSLPDATASSPGQPVSERPREVIALAEQQAEYMQLLRDKLASQDSFEINIANAVKNLIDSAALQRWITNLWPLACQTCGEPLGAKADLSADGPFGNDKVLLSLHHSGCRSSGITPPGGAEMSCATTSFAVGYLGRTDGKPRRGDIPVMVINPSCEQLQLEPGPAGGWRNATVEAFAALGFAQPNDKFPPTVHDVEAEISGDYLIVTVTGYLPDAPDHEWALKPPRHVLDQVRRLDGIAVSVVTKVVPSLLGSQELPAAFCDEEALVGWVPLTDGS
jgi:hypothetical protein